MSAFDRGSACGVSRNLNGGTGPELMGNEGGFLAFQNDRSYSNATRNRQPSPASVG